MIQHIFLDIGGVLINIHPDRCAQYWADSADLSLVEIKTAFSNEKILFNLPKGQYLLKIKYDHKTIVKKISII